MNHLINSPYSEKRKKYLFYLSLIKKTKLKLNEEKQKIFLVLKELEEYFIDYINEINQLTNEINEILNLNNENNFSDSDNNKNYQTKNYDHKKIFRMISKKCHPDKTNDKYKNELFIMASEAIKDNNVHLLIEIYESLNDENNILNLESKYDLIEKQFKSLQDEYSNLINSNTYLIMKLFNSQNKKDKLKAKEFYLDLITYKINELKEFKNQILSKKGE